eukprot:CAMPEP_0173312646 /NCGR_PEP_ID=MMETSP1143-20121109/24272_1 /TAXON_ID=483371 /ORGANISM="non described non described, Strain CCMP2298" /LENGTH=100 /DNA_ID=CAMNT_0014254913 /DNA_START=1 /DNA_END=300 /DNA_ORIENTATION=-
MTARRAMTQSGGQRDLGTTAQRDFWTSRVAGTLAVAVVLLLASLLIMDMHLSYKHAFHVQHHQATADQSLHRLHPSLDTASGPISSLAHTGAGGTGGTGG